MIENWYRLAQESEMEEESFSLEGESLQDIYNKIPEENKGGDCFEVSGKLVLSGAEGLVLVHGLVIGQGQIHGIEYAHGWVEDGNNVIDNSRGRNIVMPKDLYYILGNIDAQNTYRYNRDEVRRNILKSGTWGPWDLQSDF